MAEDDMSRETIAGKPVLLDSGHFGRMCFQGCMR